MTIKRSILEAKFIMRFFPMLISILTIASLLLYPIDNHSIRTDLINGTDTKYH